VICGLLKSWIASAPRARPASGPGDQCQLPQRPRDDLVRGLPDAGADAGRGGGGRRLGGQGGARRGGGVLQPARGADRNEPGLSRRALAERRAGGLVFRDGLGAAGVDGGSVVGGLEGLVRPSAQNQRL